MTAPSPPQSLPDSTIQRTGTIRRPRVYRWACMILLASTVSAHPREAGKPSAPKKVTQTLIIDGIWGSHKRWERLRGRIEHEVGPCAIWRYDNSGRVSIETLASALTSELNRIDRPVNLIGYSMGGLVIREALRQKPDSRGTKSRPIEFSKPRQRRGLFDAAFCLPRDEAWQPISSAAQRRSVELPDTGHLVPLRSHGISRVLGSLGKGQCPPAVGCPAAPLARLFDRDPSIHHRVSCGQGWRSREGQA